MASMEAHVVDYWLTNYVDKERQLCSLCGNNGVIDTRETAVSGAGVKSGRLNFCICPNGQAWRRGNADINRVFESR